MKSLKKVASLILIMVLALSMAMSMIACSDNTDDSNNPNGDNNNTGTTDAYTVSLKTIGGMALSGIDVYVYEDNTLANIQQFGETDENGLVTFTMPVNSNYAITLSGLPKGYQVEPFYSFNGNTAVITLVSSVIKDDSLSNVTLGLGDVMYDFTITTTEGTSLTLSEVLKEKDMVLLNFWYTSCSWCVTEFPIMEQAYQMYKEDVEIIAVDPYNEGINAIKSFQQELQLTFPMGECPIAWSNTFGITGYPTSVIIDRYGVICVIERGAITSLRPFTCAFEHFTADNYQQKICANGVADLVTNVKPTYTMDTSENIGAAINKGDITVTYRPETEDANAEYIWPFIITQKDGESCIMASNKGIESSYAIMYADVTLKAGQAIGFDYFSSTESQADIMYVIVNDDDIFQISGESDTWKSCYPWVAEEDGVYEVALCFLKDESDNVGDDTVYVKNMRVVDVKDIDTATYLPRYAATETEDSYEYVEIFYNDSDGYYHVGSKNGPLLLANLLTTTMFNEEKSVFDLVYDGSVVVDGVNMYDAIIDYCSYASNSIMSGYCTVNKELAEQLKKIASVVGFDNTENEWLKVCKYYEVYGSTTQLSDPISGLAPFSAPSAKLGKNVSTNYFYYDRAIIPRGLLAKFVPSKSGVYRITSKTDYEHGVNAWIFDENRNTLYTYEQDERMFEDETNCSMVFYMEAGKSYYIDIAFWDVYQTGYIYYDIEYMASSVELFRLAAPGYFTYDSDTTGNTMYYVITGGIDVVLGSDGRYYEDLGKDSNGKQKYGSLIYADFTGITGIFDTPIATVITTGSDGKKKEIKGMIEKGAFDFSKTEYDAFVLSYFDKNNYDADATKTELKSVWGEDYDDYYILYQVEDVLAGKYHGTGEDLTDAISAYLDDIIKDGHEEREGCVVVTKELAELLQMIMDKYTFENVEYSWLKLCYYYDYIGK